jgi:hypothetical protein
VASWWRRWLADMIVLEEDTLTVPDAQLLTL